MKNVCFYCDPRSINDATFYYINLVKTAFETLNYKFYITHSLSEVKKSDIVFVVSSKYLVFTKIKYPFKKVVYWMQGVGPEEAVMLKSGWISVLVSLFRDALALHLAHIIFFVSQEMQKHCSEKYHYNKNNYLIMPCYNLQLSKDFNIEQYKNPTFVYAGNISAWQSVDEILETYSKIESKLHNSKLYILTGNKKEFEEKISSYKIQNFEIKYVPKENLQAELHKYKYGFILREDNVVNNVATPTKMNSYLSNFIIPIFSTAVKDFNENIDLGEFTLKANCPLDPEKISQQIIEFEEKQHDFNLYKIEVENIFDNYYSDQKYLKMIRNYFQKKL